MMNSRTSLCRRGLPALGKFWFGAFWRLDKRFWDGLVAISQGSSAGMATEGIFAVFSFIWRGLSGSCLGFCWSWAIFQERSSLAFSFVFDALAGGGE